jgi:hypothetical protein
MENVLVDAGLWCCVKPGNQSGVDPDLDKQALAKINLSLKPCAAKVPNKCSTAKDVWEASQREYESTALERIVGLYASLFRTRFDKFTSMNQYVDHIFCLLQIS